MKSLSTLIDLKQRDLDEKRRILTQLEQELERLQKEEEEFKRQRDREARIASDQPEMARYFPEFLKGNELQQENCRGKQERLTPLIDLQRDQIAEAFADLKQLEIAKEKREEEEALIANRKETSELDEIGLRKFFQE